MIKIFSFGSCRSGFPFSNEDIEYKKFQEIIYGLKEIIMYLDILDGKVNIKDIPYADLLVKNPDDFDFKNIKEMIDNSDIITIEFQTFKIREYNGFYYSEKRIQDEKYRNSEIISRYKLSNEDIIQTLKEIQIRMGKPTIFISHMNFNFYDMVGVMGSILERRLIDEYLINYTENYILLKDLFKGIDYKDICYFYHNKDSNHLTRESRGVIAKEIERVSKLILGGIIKPLFHN